VTASVTAPALRPLFDTANEYRRQCEHFESALDEMLTDLDHLRGELEWKAAALCEAEAELAEQRRENQRLLAAWEERAGAFLPTASETKHDSAPWSELQLELAELRRQLFETRDGLAADISRSEVERAELTAKSERKIDELQQERAALETELAVARSRAAELHESLAQHEQERVAEREQTTAEIRHLRTLIEQQNSWLKDNLGRNVSEAHPAVPSTAGDDSKAKPAGDPVVSSVMAQFAKLQKDVAQRRKK